MKLTEITSYNLKSQTILNESWDVLTEAQRLHIASWERNVWPLMEQLNVLLEAELSPQQIQDIFANAEKLSKEQGTGLTALGKAGKVTAEVSGKIKAEIDKLIKQAADSKPVANFDAQFEKLKAQLVKQVKPMPGGQKLLAGVDKWKSFATENPAKSAFVIGAMTSVLAFASGGIMSGAAIGFFIKLANNTIKGDKLSTAIGKGVKGAAIGAVAGALGDVMGDSVEVAAPEVEGGAQTVSAKVSSSDLADASSGGAEEVASSLADMTVEEYKLQYAEELSQQFKGMSPEMVQKIADNVQINGNYPDNFSTSFNGTVVRGNIYLSPDEMAKWKQFVNPSDPFAPNGVLGSETQKWLEQNVEGVSSGGGANVVPDGGTDPETGANEPETGMKPGEGFTTDSGATYSKEDIQNLVKQAAEKGEVPDIDSLVNSKDIDAGSYADDVSSIEAELRELGIDPLKVPDEDALKAVGVEDTASDAGTSAKDEFNKGTSAKDDPDFAKDGTSAKDDPDFAPGQKPDNFDSLDPADKADALLDVPPGQWTADDYQLMKDEGMLTLQDTQTYYANNIKDIPAEARSSSIEMKKFLSAELGDEFENANAMQRSKVVKFLMQKAKVVDSIEFDQDFLMQENLKKYMSQDELHEALWDEFDMYEAGFADMMKKAGQGAKKIGQAAAKGMGKAAQTATTKAAQGAQRGVAAVKKGTAAAAKELGQKVTVRKLNATWKKLGEPTDTGSIANILADLGMSDEQIGIVGSQAKVELKAEPNATTEPAKKGPGVVDGTIDIPAFADEIKKAGPEVVKAVKAALV
jgi:hypothetical protein